MKSSKIVSPFNALKFAFKNLILPIILAVGLSLTGTIVSSIVSVLTKTKNIEFISAWKPGITYEYDLEKVTAIQIDGKLVKYPNALTIVFANRTDKSLDNLQFFIQFKNINGEALIPVRIVDVPTDGYISSWKTIEKTSDPGIYKVELSKFISSWEIKDFIAFRFIFDEKDKPGVQIFAKNSDPTFSDYDVGLKKWWIFSVPVWLQLLTSSVTGVLIYYFIYHIVTIYRSRRDALFVKTSIVNFGYVLKARKAQGGNLEYRDMVAIMYYSWYIAANPFASKDSFSQFIDPEKIIRYLELLELEERIEEFFKETLEGHQRSSSAQVQGHE